MLPNPVKRFFLWAAFFLLTSLTLAVLLVFQGATPHCRKCNVILISVDTLGAKHLGVYGYNQPTSPFLDRIAKERGIVFDRAFVQAPWTLPSHTAMLTGRYPQELGVWFVTDALPQSAKTIAEALKKRGYTTQAFSDGAFVLPGWHFDQGFVGFSYSTKQRDWDDVPQIFRKALAWLKENRNSSFFLFLRPFHVHDPYTPSPEALNAIGEEKVPEVHIQDIVKTNLGTRPNEDDAASYRLAYDGEVHELDQGLAEFFQGLEQLGLTENSVIIITADHGEEFGEHGTAGFHVTLYDETVHVPLIIFLPKAKPMRVAAVSEVRALPSTILDLLGLSADPDFKSASLMTYVRQDRKDTFALGVTALERDSVFRIIEKAYQDIEKFAKSVSPKIRTAEWNQPFSSYARGYYWKLIRNSDDTLELYDLRSDPNEKINLFPQWDKLSLKDRREALTLFRALGVPAPNP